MRQSGFLDRQQVLAAIHAAIMSRSIRIRERHGGIPSWNQIRISTHGRTRCDEVSETRPTPSLQLRLVQLHALQIPSHGGVCSN